jgi:hypothetical protein
MAQALVNRSSVAEVRTRATITEEESQVPHRLNTEKLLGVRSGVIVPFGSTSQLSPIGTVMFNGRFERDRYFLEIGAGLAVPTSGGSASYGGVWSEMGASYYLSEANFAPYVGAGIQPRLNFSATPVNFAPYTQLGFMFPRDSSTRLYADLRIAQNIIPMQFGFGSGASQTRPTEASLQLGMAF